MKLNTINEYSEASFPGNSKNKADKQTEQLTYFNHILNTSSIRVLQLAQIFPGIEKQAVEIGAIDPDTNHVNHVDMLYVCAMARHVQAQYIFEFGTYLGRTTYHLALGKAVKEIKTLDLDPLNHYPESLKLGRAVQAVHQKGLQGCFFKDQPCANLITQLHGDSRTFDYSPYFNKMDFIFIDGGHTYELVANDTLHALKLLKPGGLIVWHDFAPKSPDVVKYGQEFAEERPLFWIQNTSLLVYIDKVNALEYEAAIAPYARSLIKPVLP